jgi:TRAP-type C4-dicarboxylate transport system permease small subunit
MRRWNRLLTALCGSLAAAALLAIMLLTTADVAGRKFFAASIPGSLELTELLMVAVIFAGLPLVSLQREHVVFDTLDARLPPWLLRAQRAVIDGLCAAALAGLAGLLWVKAGQMASYGDTTAQLKLPVWPFVGAMAALCAVTAAVHLALALAVSPGTEPGSTAGGG